MHAIKKAASRPQQPLPPLVNLFAYLRELFRFSQPITDFSKSKHEGENPWWSLQEIMQWSQQASQLSEGRLPLESHIDPEQRKPLLKIQRINQLPTLLLPELLETWVEWKHDEAHMLDKKMLLWEEQVELHAAFEALNVKVAGQPFESLEEIPIVPALDPWLQFDLDEEQRVIVKVKSSRVVGFSDSPQRVEAWQAWEAKHRKNVAHRRVVSRINQLYEALHQLHFQSESCQELYLSFGLLQGQLNGVAYRHFLFHVPLEISLHQRELVLRPAAQMPIQAEEHFSPLLEAWLNGGSTQGIEGRRQQILGKVDSFNAESHEFNFDLNYLRFHYHQAAQEILAPLPYWEDRFLHDKELSWDLPAESTSPGLAYTFSPVIWVAEPKEDFPVARDADRIVKQIHQLVHEGRTGEVPDFFQHLFSLKSSENSLRIAYNRSSELKRTQGSDLQQVELEPDEGQYFFPLPYNYEQLSIAQRLEKQDAVTVKGPPGTGKSHTIANLIAHHAAKGERILVVSKNPKALEVIRKKLPPVIQELTMLFASNSLSSKTLKQGIEAASEHLSRAATEDKLHNLEAQRIRIQQEIETKLKQVQDHLALNQTKLTLSIPGQGELIQSLAEWAAYLATLPSKPHWLLEPLPPIGNVSTQLEDLLDLARSWAEIDHALLDFDWPDSQAWIHPNSLQDLEREWQILHSRVDLVAYEQLPPHAFDEEVLVAWAEVQGHLSVLERNQDLLRSAAFRPDFLQKIWLKYGQQLNQLDALAAQFLSFKFDFSACSESQPEQLLELLLNLMGRYDRDGQLNLITRRLLPKAEKSFFDCHINGKAMSSYRDLRKAASYLQWQVNQENLRRTVENYFQHLNAPLPQFKAVKSPLEAARRMLTELKAVEQAYLEIEAFNHSLAARQLPTLNPKDIDPSTLAFLAGLSSVARSHEIQEQLFQAARQLAHAGTHPIVSDLQSCIQVKDHGRYQLLIDQYQSLREQANWAKALYQRAQGWAEDLPQSMEALMRGEIPADLGLADLKQDLFRIELEEKLATYLAELGAVQPLLKEVKQARLAREKLTAELAAERAWHARRRALTEDQLSSLAAWRNDLINVGKGFGKNTARHLASARQNLKNVQGALPVWIMQQDVVTRLFDQPEPGQFDLLIIDEASQCDISALNLIFRAKKSVIVGDENQTSVSTHAQQFPLERTNRILDRYLIHHPYKQQFNLNNRTASIYSLSGVVYPNVITLREHFRCVPEIIGFSNQEVYHHKIQSLRTSKSGRWGQATEIHYLEDDPKKSLKPQLAKQTALAIRGMIEDYELGHITALPTVGVICLESSNEAHLEALTKELGRDPKLKAYRDQLQLRVGTARHFQGDERDLIILTTTASHSRTAKGKLKPPRAVLGEDMMRIYNVAVSRARDKVILLHSILPEAIPLMNPDCYRKRLIDWMMQSEPLIHPIPSSKTPSVQTEEDLLAELCSFFASEGFTELHPKFQVAGRHLDLVIGHGKGSKGLIVEAPDHPQVLSLSDQALLERTGWDLYRLPSTLWHLAPDQVKSTLRKWLN